MCGLSVNFTEEILRDVLVRGIADQGIQLDLLSDQRQDMTLEEMIKFIEAKESGKRSASRLLDTHSVEAVVSTYRLDKCRSALSKSETQRPDTNDAKNQAATCRNCGEKGHGKNSLWRVRRTECPAYGKKCLGCSRDNHFQQMCRGRKPVSGSTNTDACDQQTEALVELCATSAIGHDAAERTLTLDHYLYDNLCNRWLKQSSRPQPFLNLKLSVAKEDYHALGFRLDRRVKSVTLPAMADTGCQSCLIGVDVIERMGMNSSENTPKIKLKFNLWGRKRIYMQLLNILPVTKFHVRMWQFWKSACILETAARRVKI